jgi:hypothetical protein
METGGRIKEVPESDPENHKQKEPEEERGRLSYR